MFRSLHKTIVAAIVLATAMSACGSSGGIVGDIDIAEGTNFSQIAERDREEAPEVSGEQVRPGEPPIDQSYLEGRVAVINFWGSWCGPCRKEEPILEEASRDLGNAVTFLGVNSRRDQRAAAIAFLDEFDVSFPSIYDPSSSIAAKFGVRTMPATIILDANGRIAVHVIGAIRSLEELKMLIEGAS